MKQASIEERMLHYRSLPDFRLLDNEYIIIMLDGRGFSNYCKRFKKPFDEKFVNIMNETAKYLCEEVEGCKFGYTQSDEISLLVTDFGLAEPWLGNRLCKIQSVSASLASAKFNQLIIADLANSCKDLDEFNENVSKIKLASFDSKAWNVPSENDVFTWFLYRQCDCIKNSKQMAARSQFSQKELNCLTTDQMVELLLNKSGIDWNDYPDGEKYGRFLYKEEVELQNGENTFKRNKWFVHDAFPLYKEEGKERLLNLNVIPKK